MDEKKATRSRDLEISNIETTIAALEAQRHTLGDLVVDTALELLRERLATLIQPDQAPDERKRVTVLFADVSGYTALSENLDPEDVAAIMNRLFEAVTVEIHKFGGTVDKYSGDAVMALFGAPLALENHEEMAVRAALGMQQVITEFSAELQRERGFAVQMRIGLNTGEVLAGLVGGLRARSYTVMGDTVNLASRLEHACPVGRVMISGETARPLPAIFDLEPPQQITVKGKSEPITTYLVVGEKAERGRVRGLAGLYAPMVGREAEFAALQELFTRVLREQFWRATAVTGDAGIGKSRLQREFVAWVMQTRPDTRILSGRCYSHTRTSPYAFIAELMRGLFHISPDASPDNVISQLSLGLKRLDPRLDEAEHRYQLGSVAGVLGISLPDDPLQGLDPEQRRDRTFLSLERILYAASAQSPLLILVDDLHWADALSLAFLDRLLQMMARDLFSSHPALFLILGRPSEDPAVIYGRILSHLAQPPFQVLPLATLNTAQSADLISALLSPDIPADLRQLIIDHAQGNPFYVEEVLRSLIEDGTLQRDDDRDRWLITRSVADISIPPSVQGILAARLDRLPLEDKRITQFAAIIGRIFWQKLLREVAGTDSVEPTLLLLELRQLADRLGQSQIAEDWEWVFHHVLIQEVAYSSVPKSTRRVIHQQVAQALEDELSERTTFLLPLIAYHYETGNVPQKAIDYLARAGEQAAAQFANDDAVDYFSRALSLLPQLAKQSPLSAGQMEMQYRLLNGRIAVYHIIGQREAQATDLAALAALAATIQNPGMQANAALLHARYYEALSDFENTIQSAIACVHFAGEAHDATLRVEGLNVHALGLLRQGKLDEARAHLQTALSQASAAADVRGQSISHINLGIASFFADDYSNGRIHLEKALAFSRQIRDIPRQTACLINLVGVYYGLGDVAKARAYGEEALSIARAIGDRAKEIPILNNLGALYHALGDLNTAAGFHETALSLSITLNNRHEESAAASNLGLVFHDLQQHTKARHFAERALAIDRHIGDQIGEGYSLTALAMALEGLTLLAEAAEHHQQAITLRRKIGQDALAIDNLAGLCRVQLAQGSLAAAHNTATACIAWIDDNGEEGIEYPVRVYLAAAAVAQQQKDARQARHLLARAEESVAKKASKISDPEIRQRFIANVRDHQLIRELMAQL